MTDAQHENTFISDVPVDNLASFSQHAEQHSQLSTSAIHPNWYAIMAEDVPDSLLLRRAHRPAHLARLEILRDEGRLLLAGPHPVSDDSATPRFTGSLIVAAFDSLDAAQSWAQNDPFAVNGIYANIAVKPFIKTMP